MVPPTIRYCPEKGYNPTLNNIAPQRHDAKACNGRNGRSGRFRATKGRRVKIEGSRTKRFMRGEVTCVKGTVYYTKHLLRNELKLT